MSEATILEVLEDAEFSYPEDPQCIYSIPAGLSLSLGEAWCIHGISGSGKSTLMTLLAALRRIAKGKLRYSFGAGAAVEVTASTWDAVVGPHLWHRVGFAFQRPELIRALTVSDNLRLAVDGTALKRSVLFKAKEWDRIAGSQVWEISGGQIQRLGLLRAFGRGQRLVFLDEPTNNLDRRNRGDVADFVQSHRSTHALVVVSHDDDFIHSLSVDRIFDVREVARNGTEVCRELRPA